MQTRPALAEARDRDLAERDRLDRDRRGAAGSRSRPTRGTGSRLRRDSDRGVRHRLLREAERRKRRATRGEEIERGRERADERARPRDRTRRRARDRNVSFVVVVERAQVLELPVPVLHRPDPRADEPRDEPRGRFGGRLGAFGGDANGFRRVPQRLRRVEREFERRRVAKPEPVVPPPVVPREDLPATLSASETVPPRPLRGRDAREDALEEPPRLRRAAPRGVFAEEVEERDERSSVGVPRIAANRRREPAARARQRARREGRRQRDPRLVQGGGPRVPPREPAPPERVLRVGRARRGFERGAVDERFEPPRRVPKHLPKQISLAAARARVFGGAVFFEDHLGPRVDAPKVRRQVRVVGVG